MKRRRERGREGVAKETGRGRGREGGDGGWETHRNADRAPQLRNDVEERKAPVVQQR
jgi:hypothetical protein